MKRIALAALVGRSDQGWHQQQHSAVVAVGIEKPKPAGEKFTGRFFCGLVKQSRRDSPWVT